MAEKHRLFVFAKLKSFQKAAEEDVKGLLNAVVARNENLRGKVTVGSFRRSGTLGGSQSGHSACDGFTTSTAVVVIDARQSRVCLAPHKRDRNIDHRQELAMLSRTATKPKGSILVVIYGDSKSKDLGDEFIADKWPKQWKHRDRFAWKLAQDRRIFSVSDEFNSTQVDCIVDYLIKLPLIPSTPLEMRTRDSNILVIGQRGDTLADGDLHSNPFLTNHVVQRDRHFTVELSRPLASDDDSRRQISNALTYFVNGFPTLKLCENHSHSAMTDNLKAKYLRSYGINNVFNLYCVKIARMLWFNRFPKFDRVILLCHCERCFAEILNEEDQIMRYLGRQLDKLGIALRSNARVLPIISSKPARYSSPTLERARNTIEDLMDQDVSLSEDEISRHKGRLRPYKGDDFIMRLYSMYAFQPSSARGKRLLSF
ncbi:uncharacterized protein [Ptychodera flava]|uniref:uncharacterized protein n=1 Tax=Ptychodera flava TaxID=63121 RepID=UPI00396A7F6E